MSRSGYSDGCNYQWQMTMWLGQVASAVRGRRGQAFLRDLVAALEAMPDKRLIRCELRKDGDVCALGALGARRGIPLESIDPEDYDGVAAAFDIASQLAREIVWNNDEVFDRETPEERWRGMLAWAKERIRASESSLPKTQREDNK